MKINLKPERFLKHLSLLACFALTGAIVRAADPVTATAPIDAGGNFSGRVLETMSTAGYTYVQIDTGSQKLWAATTHIDLNKGDQATVVGAMPMINYHSKSLNRDFDVIYFTGKIVINSDDVPKKSDLPSGHPALPGTTSRLCRRTTRR